VFADVLWTPPRVTKPKLEEEEESVLVGTIPDLEPILGELESPKGFRRSSEIKNRDVERKTTGKPINKDTRICRLSKARSKISGWVLNTWYNSSSRPCHGPLGAGQKMYRGRGLN